MTSALPAALAEIRGEFLELPEPERLQLLLEYSGELPVVPEEIAAHPEMPERVAECQSPVYIHVAVDEGVVALHATAPADAPATRGSRASSSRASPSSPPRRSWRSRTTSRRSSA